MKLHQLTGFAATLMCASTIALAADAHHNQPAAAAPAADSHAAPSSAKDAHAKDAHGKDAHGKDAHGKDAHGKDAHAKDAPAKEAAADDHAKPAPKKTRKSAHAKPSHKAPTHGTQEAHGHTDPAAPAAHASHHDAPVQGANHSGEGHGSKRLRVKDRSAATAPASHNTSAAHAAPVADSHAAAPAKAGHDAKAAADSHHAPSATAPAAAHASPTAKDHHDEHAGHAASASKDSHAAKDSHATKDSHAAKDSHVAPAAAHHDAPASHAAPSDHHGPSSHDKTSHAASSGDYCNPPLKSEVAALFDRWNASLRTGDPKKVAANYAPGSVLLPTVSNRPRFTAAEKEDYFAHFLARRPEGSIDDRVIEVDCNSATDAGLYTFRFSDGTSVKARYSFSYKKVGSQWLITSHHSSAMPEKAEVAHEHPVSATTHAKPVDKSDQGSPSKGWVRYP